MFGYKENFENYKQINQLAGGMWFKFDIADSSHLYLENHIARQSLATFFV